MKITNSDHKKEQEYKKNLTEEQYKIMREGGTEAPGSSDLLHIKDDGMYRCAACGKILFGSDTKFDSKSGWPSFTDPKNKEKVTLHDDYSFGMHRTEVKCANCGSHLGHVFDDGPGPNGKRYCINGACLIFDPSSK